MNLLNIIHKTGFLGFTRAMLKKRRSVAILLHGTYGKTFEGVPPELHFGMPAKDLDDVLQWIRRERIDIIDLDAYFAGKPGLLITLDDGYANNADHGLKVLEKYEAPATIFVATRHLSNDPSDMLDYFAEVIREKQISVSEEAAYELYGGLTNSQLRLLSKHPLIHIGSHTHNHPMLTRLTPEQVRFELLESKRIIGEVTGKVPTTFSYPFGDYNREVLEQVKQLYALAFAVNPVLGTDPLFELPRIGIYHKRPEYLSAKLSFIFKSQR